MGLINLFRNFYISAQHNQFSNEHISEIQKHRFRRLLRYAALNSKFYRELYRGIDINECHLSDLPVLTKSAMMNNFDCFITDSRLKLDEIQEWVADRTNYGKFYLGEFLPIPTSGSCGEYALVLYHRKAIDMVRASLFARHPLNADYSLYDYGKILVNPLLGVRSRMAVIAVPYGNLGIIVRTLPPSYRFFANLKIFSLFDPIDKIVTALNEFQPDCIATNSFFLAILAQEQLAGNLNIMFRQTMSFMAGTGEPLTEQTNRLAMKAWNLDIQDDYGAAECYFMATSCRKFGRLHAMSDLCILEMVDGDGHPVPRGEYGEKVLLTNLFNFTQPIIRYELEDIAGYADQGCECGLAFPTLLPLRGRTSDFLYFEKPQGGYERFHPYRFRIPLFYAHILRQYQIVQTERNELTFLYVPQTDTGVIEQQLRQTLEKALAQASLESRLTLKIKKVQSIHRDDQTGKFKIIKSLGPPSDRNPSIDTSTY